MSWHYPDHRDGTTIACLTDTHFGYRDWTQNQLHRAGQDIDRLAPYLDGVVHAGDGIHWGQDGPEDGQMNMWLWDRYRTGVPWLLVPGNHDMSSFTTVGQQVGASRTAHEWAGVRGMTEPNTVQTMGAMTIIGVGPDSWDFTANGGEYGPLVLTEAHVAWIDEQLWAAGPNPCWIVAHTPLPEQYPGHLTAPASLNTVLSRPNVAGWISGHRHHNIQAWSDHNTGVYAFGGHESFHLNCPSVGGNTGGTVDSTPFDDQIISTFITYRGDRVDLRWRDHLNQRWVTDGAGVFVRTLTRSV